MPLAATPKLPTAICSAAAGSASISGKAKAIRAPIERPATGRACMAFLPCLRRSSVRAADGLLLADAMDEEDETSLGGGRDVAEESRGHGARGFRRHGHVNDAHRAGARAAHRFGDGGFELGDAAHRAQAHAPLAAPHPPDTL